MPDSASTGADQWRFDGLNALYINCTLKRSPEPSHTQGLIDVSRSIMEGHGVAVEELRAVDHDIATGVWPDMTEHGWPSDEWPASTPTTAGSPAAWSPATRTGSSTAP